MAMDPELAAIYKAESEEHLQTLTEGFLALESGSAGQETLEEMFRATHQFKGASRVVGAEGPEVIAHRLEDLLESMCSGHLFLTPAQHDVLSALTDRLGELVVLAMNGEEKGPETEALLASLDAYFPAASNPARKDISVAESEVKVTETQKSNAVAPIAQAVAPSSIPPPCGGHPFIIDTLKVPTQRLDDLLNLAGELLVSHQRLKRRSEDAEKHAELLEDLLRRESKSGPHWEAVQSRALNLAEGLREDENRLDSLLGSLEDAVRRTRLVPLSRLFGQIPKWVRDMARQTGKEVSLEVIGGEIEMDKHILEGLKDPLLHLLRNALDHGLETSTERIQAGKTDKGLVRVQAEGRGDKVAIRVEDDGRGVDPEAIRRALAESGRLEPAQAANLDREALIHQLFMPGFSTKREVTILSGRGVGLDIVRAKIEDLKGSILLSSEPHRGTRVEIMLPLSLATTRVLLVEAQKMRLGIPAATVQCCRQLPFDQRFPVEGRECFLQDGNPIMLLPLAQFLGAHLEEGTRREPQMAVVLQHLGERVGLSVDNLLGEQEILQKPLGPRLKQLSQFSGASLLGDGGLCLILNPSELIARVKGMQTLAELPAQPAIPIQPKWKILLVDDSLTTRIQLRRVLESANFSVTLAVDGLDAWSKLCALPFDALVSDVDMPGLDGFSLTERVRATEATAKLPVVLVTTLSQPEQQRRGLDAGANAYLLKARFDQTELVETLKRLL